MKIFIQVVNDNVEGYGSTKGNESDIEIEVADDHEVLRNPFAFKYVNDQLVKDNSFLLDKEKEKKIAEMDQACNEAILAGFKHMINGTEYHFSSSISAQMNFQGVDSLFKDNLVPNGLAEWTVTDKSTGEIERILIDKTTFNTIKLKLFLHINSNISKFRNTLQPQIEAASTVTQVSEISW